MRLVSLLDLNGMLLEPTYAPGFPPDRNFDFLQPVSRVRNPNNDFLIANTTRPGKLPIEDDWIEIRHLQTNRFTALQATFEQASPRLILSENSVDHRVGSDRRMTALIQVTEVHQRPDGILIWRLKNETAPLSEYRIAIWDHSLTAVIVTEDNRGWNIRDNTVGLASHSKQELTFHPFEPDDILELKAEQWVYLSINGSPIVPKNVASQIRPLELGQLQEGSLNGEVNSIYGGSLASPVGGSIDDTPVLATFQIVPLYNTGILRPGDRFRLKAHPSLIAGKRGYLVERGGALVIDSTAIESLGLIFKYEPLVDLKQYYNAAVNDNAIFTGAAPSGYSFVRSEGQVFSSPRSGTVPIKQFRSTTRNDIMSTATNIGQEAAYNAGYQYVGVLGWAYSESTPFTAVARQYWHSGRRDNMLTATPDGEKSVSSYSYAYDDCFVLPPSNPQSERPGRDGPPNIELPGHPQDHLYGGERLNRVRDNWRNRIPVDWGPRKVKALVLSGGGAKGAFEAGAIRELWNQGYRPDIVCGVSVGAINALKIAENERATGDNLVNLWRSFAADPQGIYIDSFYVRLLQRTLDAVAGELAESGILTVIGAALGGLPAAAVTAALSLETNDTNENLRRLMNLILSFHSVHSMEPLRLLLENPSNLDANKVRANGVQLRLGITDVKSGTYFSVTQPTMTSDAAPGLPANIGDYGWLESEPDATAGDTWLTQPLWNVNGYKMRVQEAAYCSSIIPVFMEPLESNLSNLRKFSTPDGSVALVDTAIPESLRMLLNAAAPGGRLPTWRDPIDWSALSNALDQWSNARGLPANGAERGKKIRQMARFSRDLHRGLNSQSRVYADGGLTDAIPLRTALRLGATEIMVIGVDQLYKAGTPQRPTYPLTDYGLIDNIMGSSGLLGGANIGDLPAIQALLSTLGHFVHGNTRNDMLAGLGVLDARRITNIARANIQASASTRFESQLMSELKKHEMGRYQSLGALTSAGGQGFNDYNSISTGAVSVDMVLPDRELLDALAFNDIAGVNEAIELGRLSAKSPMPI